LGWLVRIVAGFVKKYCWLVYVREKYCSGWKFTIIYDKPQPNEQAVVPSAGKQYIYTTKVRDEISGYVGYLGNMARKKQANFHEGKQVHTAGDGRHI